MQDLVDTALLDYPDVLGLVYYDDVLLASPHAWRLEMVTQYLVDYLRSNNLRIADHKCALTPSREMYWIVKHISHYIDSNNGARTRQIGGVLMGLA